MLLDYATIIGRAAWVRHQAGFIGKAPPYSSRHLLEKVFPNIPVAGTSLPKGVTEMAVAQEGRRALFYSRKFPHTHQRVGLIHGLYHHLSDIKQDVGIRECSLIVRNEGRRTRVVDPVELACDLFAAEVLTPLDVLDEYAPDVLFSRDAEIRGALDDEIDNLASRFNVPVGFMRWRLMDLRAMRRSHYNPEF